MGIKLIKSMLRVTCESLLKNKSSTEKSRVNLRKRLLEILFEYLDPLTADFFKDISFLLAVNWVFLTCNSKHSDNMWLRAVVN